MFDKKVAGIKNVNNTIDFSKMSKDIRTEYINNNKQLSAYSGINLFANF